MAQQTINVGTAPNDGTGTPLRTAFQYTNSNFSELYTAVGPSGNNIVVPGSATITGDLTVDTSTLKVDSANDVVGVGTNSPNGWGAKFVSLRSTTGISYTGVWNDGTNNPRLEVSHTSTGTVLNATSSSGGAYSRLRLQVAGADQYQIDTSGVFTWYDGAGGTRMTLNSTGLGIGASPTNKLDVSSSDAAVTLRVNTQNAGASASNYSQIQLSDVGTVRSYWRNVRDGAGTTQFAYNSYLQFLSDAAGTPTERMRIDSSGNVGIGVTPSAWGSNYKVVQVGQAGAVYGSAPTGFYGTKFNIYNDNTNDISITNNFVGEYRFNILNGSHIWFNKSTSSGGIGVNQTLTQAMTLDASGNLLVKKTAIDLNVGVMALATGVVESTMASSSGAQSTMNVYSTGAAAYRFYVGMNGTINATNTTISAISDARLKENVQDIDVGLGAILALKPRKFDWKAGKGKDIKGDRGFIAQEFEEVFPNLIDEWKDAAPEGEAPYKSVRQDLIPVLVKAIQELTARVQTLETR